MRTQRNVHSLDKPGTLFALKVLKKKVIRYLDEVCTAVVGILSGIIIIIYQRDHEKKDVERSVLSILPWSPFVSGAIETFYDSKNLYLMLELIPCGTLRSLIQKYAPFDPPTASFYFANIVCGLAFLQERDIVHRDLKPENILVGPDGYLCLADFGSAAVVKYEDNWLLVGSISYMAPEAISPVGQTQKFGKALDWWSSGCILYEMVTRKMVNPEPSTSCPRVLTIN